MKIVIDARKHKTGKLGEKKFQAEMEEFLKQQFVGTDSEFKTVPSYHDILVELANFVSNTFYKEYQVGSEHIFKKVGLSFIKIENPL